MPSLVGPRPGDVVVSATYLSEERIQQRLLANGSSEAKEMAMRLQGVAHIDNVRKAADLPINTFCVAVDRFHRFRLKSGGEAYNLQDVAIAALFVACKIEETHKKSRELLCVAYNLKATQNEKTTPDDKIFDKPAIIVIGLERIMLETSAFDFRTRSPHKFIAKAIKAYGVQNADKEISRVAFYMGTDAYRTWAPLKHVPAAIALACVELSARLHDVHIEQLERALYYEGRGHFASVERPMVMETMLDLLDLYTHHRNSSINGSLFPIDKYIAVRIALNQESKDSGWPRFIDCSDRFNGSWSVSGVPSPSEPSPSDKGRPAKPSPASPAKGGAAGKPKSETTQSPATPSQPQQPVPAAEKHTTFRFMLDLERAADEQKVVEEFFAESEEEYETEVEEEIEVRHQEHDGRRDRYDTGHHNRREHRMR